MTATTPTPSRKSPLHDAASAADAPIIEALLAAGADANAEDWQGRTPLHRLAGRSLGGPASMSRQACMRLLLNAGADVNRRDVKGATALHSTAWAQDPETIIALYNAGADLHVKEESGRTPMDICMEYQNYSCALALRSVGVPIQSHAYGNLTMRQAAIKAGLIERLNHLLDYHLPESDVDAPARLATFALDNDSQACAALLQARLAQHQLATIRGASNTSTLNQWDGWFAEGLCSAARMFNRTLVEARSPVEYKSREKLVEMSIDDFLSLCRHEVGEGKLANTRSITRQAIPIRELPFLQVAPSTDEPDHLVVDGHEGRHRARALAELGFKTMPVLLRAAHIRWSEQADPVRWDYKTEWPAKIRAERGAQDEHFIIDMPVAREDSAKPYPIDQFWPSPSTPAKNEKSNGAQP